jgi:hypothetical protein
MAMVLRNPLPIAVQLHDTSFFDFIFMFHFSISATSLNMMTQTTQTVPRMCVFEVTMTPY